MYQEEIETSRGDLGSDSSAGGTGYYANLTRSILEMNPRFVGGGSSRIAEQPHDTQTQTLSRIQHDYDSGNVDLTESGANDADQGLCLSMVRDHFFGCGEFCSRVNLPVLFCFFQWQPWASLLVYGIKVVEGRSWPTTHRGRLWIAAAAKKASPEEMTVIIEQHVAQAQAGKPLPKIFPTSCVLGCVDIVDCLTQEQYQANVPDPLQRQSESPHVFICSNPRILKTQVPISGDHKIFSLEPEVLQRCRDLLKKQDAK